MDIYYQNIRGIRTKTNEIYQNILQSNYKIIVFTETWLNQHIHSKEFIDDRYNVYRRDRHTSSSKKSDGGGVLVAVSRELESTRVKNWETECEDLWVTIKININGIIKKIALCATYLPPPVKLETLNAYLHNVNDVIDKVDDAIILGDFNLGFIRWNSECEGSHAIPTDYNNALGHALVDFISLNSLYQYNKLYNSDNRILDLVLSTLSTVVISQPLELISRLDPKHPNILVQFSFSNIRYLQPKCRNDYNFFKADYCNINLKLHSINWNEMLRDCVDVDGMVTVFYSKLQELIDAFVPKRKSKPKKYPPWFSKGLIKLLAEQNKLRLKYRLFGNPRDKFEYSLIRDRCHKLIKKSYQEYKCSLETDMRKDPKKFWRYIKSKRKEKSSLPAEMHLKGETAYTGDGVANLFANHFSSIYSDTEHNESIERFLLPETNGPRVLCGLSISEKDILNKIKRLDIYKCAGPDNIPSVFIKRCRTQLALPLAIIFNYSLKHGTFPAEWKKARVTPIHKKDDESDVSNYRPISILSCFSKLFESLVYPAIAHHVECTISDHQHGFCRNRSTETNLVSFISNLSRDVDAGSQIDVIYTDFSSAFDKVSHHLLILKLRASGIHGSLLNWFRSYLQRRSQIVAVNGYESRIYNAESGVPQGSHLGPVLFSLFIDDITAVIKHCKFSLFADDLKIYAKIHSLTDSTLIQHDLNRLQCWCEVNHMVINPKKCFFIKFTKKRVPFECTYALCGETITEVNEIRDLGVVLDSKLSFIPHINVIAKKSAQMLGFVKRNTKGFQVDTKIVLYNSLVRSHLEYASSAWNPTYAVHSQRIEGIQRAFTRHLAFLSSGISHRSPYTQRLQHFHMTSLKNRRLIHDLLLLHKILNGKITCGNLLELIGLQVPYHLPRHPVKAILRGPHCRTNLGFHSPISRMCLSYNRLLEQSPDIDIFRSSYNVFKNLLYSLFS